MIQWVGACVLKLMCGRWSITAWRRVWWRGWLRRVEDSLIWRRRRRGSLKESLCWHPSDVAQALIQAWIKYYSGEIFSRCFCILSFTHSTSLPASGTPFQDAIHVFCLLLLIFFIANYNHMVCHNLGQTVTSWLIYTYIPSQYGIDTYQNIGPIMSCYIYLYLVFLLL